MGDERRLYIIRAGFIHFDPCDCWSRVICSTINKKWYFYTAYEQYRPLLPPNDDAYFSIKRKRIPARSIRSQIVRQRGEIRT